MNFPPQAFIIGAQKAGTTTLAFLLDQHPQIAVSQPKETYYFTLNWEKGLEWYRGRFNGPDTSILVDATPGYSMISDPNLNKLFEDQGARNRAKVPQRIYSVCPNAKFIYILRDPVERTYSAYWHNVRAGGEVRPFRKAISENPVYLSAGDYAFQIKRYLEHFDLESFCFLLFEEFRKMPDETARKCFKFLGAGPTDFSVTLDERKNRSYQYNLYGRIFTSLMPSKEIRKQATKLVKTVLPQSKFAALRTTMTQDIPEMNDDDRAWLIDHFGGRNHALTDLTGISTKLWQN